MGEAIIKFLGVIVALFGIIVLALLLRGFVVGTLWNWFAVPLFALPVVTIPQALAISLVVGTLTEQYKDHKIPEDEKYEWYESLLRLLGSNGIVLLVGYILTFYI